MAAQKRIHDTPAARVAAHREKQAERGMKRVEITLPANLAEKLKLAAQAEATTPSAIVAALLAAALDPAE